MRKIYKGFTLVEMLIVVAMIAILAAIILFALQGGKDRADIGSGLVFANHNYQGFAQDAFAIYNFNDNSSSTIERDLSDNGRDLTPVKDGAGHLLSAFIRNPDTPSGNGYSMDSLKDYNDIYGYWVGTPISNINSYTISAWVKSGIPGEQPILTIEHQNKRIIGMTIYYPDVGLGALINCGESSAISGDYSSYTLNNVPSNVLAGNYPLDRSQGKPFGAKWYQITCSLNDATHEGSVYVNGHLIYNEKNLLGLSGIENTPAEMRVGASSNQGIIYNAGLLDDVIIYTNALTASEVYKLYAATAPAHGIAIDSN